MGQRYGKLPSQLFVEADTFDLMVMDVALSYQTHKSSKYNNEVDQNLYNTEELQAKLEKVRSGR